MAKRAEADFFRAREEYKLHGLQEALPTVAFSADFCKRFYPAASRRLEERGTVVLMIYVTEDGRPAVVKTLASSDYARLDEAAEQCVIEFGRFWPPQVDGRVASALQRFVVTW
jgi:protein TonB